MSEHARRPRSVRTSVAVAIALFGAGVATPLAWSQDPPPPPEEPAISQYVETLPSGGGGQAVGVGKSQTKPLPKHAAKKLTQKATPLAPKLRSIATDSSYGAPQRTLPSRAAPAPTRAKPAKTPKRHTPTPVRRSDRPPTPVRSVEPDRTALSAAVSAATGGRDRGPLILLGVIVVFTTAAGLAAAAQRARQAH
jgi:hypothetical protein